MKKGVEGEEGMLVLTEGLKLRAVRAVDLNSPDASTTADGGETGETTSNKCHQRKG